MRLPLPLGPAARRRVSSSVSHGAIALAALAVLTPVAAGQTRAGAENSVTPAHSTLTGGESSQSATFSMDGGVGQSGAGAQSASRNFILQSSVVWMEPTIETDNPVVFGTSLAGADQMGGEGLELFGFGFTQTSVFGNEVSFGSEAAPVVMTATNTKLRVRTPPGRNEFLNPLGSVPVTVTNSAGSGIAEGVFAYMPALTQTTPAQVGKPTRFSFYGEPGSYWFLFLGQPAPGFEFQVAGIAGTVELPIFQGLMVNSQHVPSGYGTADIVMPASPIFAGSKLTLQALIITDIAVFSGAFSNVSSSQVFP